MRPGIDLLLSPVMQRLELLDDAGPIVATVLLALEQMSKLAGQSTLLVRTIVVVARVPSDLEIDDASAQVVHLLRQLLCEV